MNKFSTVRNIFLIQAILFPFAMQAQQFVTKFEKSNNETVTYKEGINYWQNLASAFNELQMIPLGESDSGKPIHLLLVSENGYKTIESMQGSKKPLLFINNAIHPGEPCGVDASMMFVRDLLQSENKRKWLQKVNIVLIPFYNIGGALNRGSYSRANQVGPKEYGFRGNAKNLDLNRDFIKADSKNAMVFNKVFSALKPEIFVDNHTTNGADYQYSMTLIASMAEHYQQPLRELFSENLIPFLYESMEKNYEMVPYVNSVGRTPFDGLAHFTDLPRYSMGYASLHNALSFTPEAHMLKPYANRVQSTYSFMNFITSWLSEHSTQVLKAKELSVKQFHSGNNDYVLQWEIDTTKYTFINFKGYQPKYKPSEVSGQDRLYYDRSEPVTKQIKFYNKFKPEVVVQKPKSYVIPQAYTKVIERLLWNGIDLNYLNEDKELEVAAYRILDFKTVERPYENHYLHSDVKLQKFTMKKHFYKGDVVVNVNQPGAKYILESLEPQGADSFFAWNFFDGVLQQKEYFSPYLFEDEAAELLKKHPKLKQALEARKAKDAEFAKNGMAQLYFIYKKSDHYEPTHNVYPVYRIEN